MRARRIIRNCLKTRLIELSAFVPSAVAMLLMGFFREISSSVVSSSRPNDAAKTDVAHSGVDHLRLPRRRAVTQAIVGST